MLPINSFWYYLAAVIFLSFLGCQKPTEPQKLSPPTVVITPEDASCTEVWLRLQFSTEEPVTSVTLSRNDSIIYRNTIFPADTVFFDAGLEPNRVYLYNAAVTDQKGKKYDFMSEVRTLDTTSSDYVWQTFVFGEHSHSIIRDIAVIDENNIWAVGDIYLKDNFGNNDFTCYNMAHWDGQSWNLLQTKYYTQSSSFVTLISSIKVFSSENIWYGNLLYMEQDSFYSIPLNISFPSLIMDIAGPDPKNIVVIGENGNLAHYNGSSWTKLESQTNLDLTSITYYEGKYYIIGNKEETGYSCLLELKDNVTKKIFEGSWFTPHNGEYVGELLKINQYSKYGIYIRSDGWIYRLEVLRDSFYLKQTNSRFTRYTYDMSGTGHNNIWVAGEGGTVGHYNGINYQEISSIRNSATFYRCVNVNGNVVAIGGEDLSSPLLSKARITIGKKIR
ncbi:MAG: hypothetical protein FMNOHCHN_00033 [Ignavibacteriaceae bacterium]|nr:hypothetical protein [Ignavibacteriaceae bacterium]